MYGKLDKDMQNILLKWLFFFGMTKWTRTEVQDISFLKSLSLNFVKIRKLAKLKQFLLKESRAHLSSMLKRKKEEAFEDFYYRDISR